MGRLCHAIKCKIRRMGEKPSLLGMFTSPGLQFERIKTKEKFGVYSF